MTEREATPKDDKGKDPVQDDKGYSDRVGEEEWEEECEGDAKPLSGKTCIDNSLAAQRHQNQPAERWQGLHGRFSRSAVHQA